MEFLNGEFFGNPTAGWLKALAIGLAIFIALQALKRLFLARWKSLAEKSKTQVDDLILSLLGQTRSFFILILSIYAASLALVLPESAGNGLRLVFLIVLLLQIGLWLNGAISFWIARRVRSRLEADAGEATSLNALGLVAKGVVWTVILLLALDNIPGVEVNTLIASLGITGIAVGLAVQNILGDLFASLSIALDKPFVIGDFIIVGDLLGTVEHIGLKSTRIRSLTGEQLIFGNADLLSSRIRNFKRMERRRIVGTFGVTYQTGLEQLEKIAGYLKEIVEAQPEVTFDRAHFKEFGDFALVFEYVYFVETPDYVHFMNVQQAINLALYRRLQEAGVDFAYPTQTVFLGKTAA